MMQFVTGRTTEIIIPELTLLYWIAIGRISVVQCRVTLRYSSHILHSTVGGIRITKLGILETRGAKYQHNFVTKTFPRK